MISWNRAKKRGQGVTSRVGRRGPSEEVTVVLTTNTDFWAEKCSRKMGTKQPRQKLPPLGSFWKRREKTGVAGAWWTKVGTGDSERWTLWA